MIAARQAVAEALPWIGVAPGAPYFVDEDGRPFTPIGQNDAISWVELKGLYKRRDIPAVRAHLLWLKGHGVTVLRVMLEYAQARSHYFERPAGVFNPVIVQLWDDLFALCEEVGLRLLLTPYDTFWMWIEWGAHPYNVANGGPLASPSRLLLDEAARALIRERLLFAVRRWGGSGAIFAWDLWNEIHPAQAEDSCEPFADFITDLSATVRVEELRLYGRSHPQTVSLFGSELLQMPHMDLATPVFRHPDLDFATLHIYATGTIDNPRNTVAPAIAMGDIVRQSLAEITDGRPFLDTEHGPIHTFKDRRKTLPEAFDDEYFARIQWAHLASGGAGGGMRWPNRHPHALTPGMRRAQASLARFCELVDWTRFRRRNLNREIVIAHKTIATFGCADEDQAIVWLLRRKPAPPASDAPSIGSTLVRIPGLSPGTWRITPFDTGAGKVLPSFIVAPPSHTLSFETPPFGGDIAFAAQRLP